jgi:hypothetical protein
MDPNILTGSRKLFTDVDTYALRDLGWTIPDSAVPEPSTPMLLACAMLISWRRRPAQAG